MRRGPWPGRVVAFLVASLMLLAAPAAQAQGGGGPDAAVRFFHAIPGAGAVKLQVGGVAVGSAAFGEATETVKVPAGRRQLTLAAGGGGVGARTVEALEAAGDYTVVALLGAGGEQALRVYRDAEAAAGRARVRAINAAPELGAPAVRVGDRSLVQQLRYGDATAYETVTPGTYPIAAVDPAGGETVAKVGSAPLTAGTVSTAVIVGTRGQPLEIVLVEGASAAPRAAPETGLGGLAGDGAPRWLLALLAALAAGSLGGLAFRLARRGAG